MTCCRRLYFFVLLIFVLAGFSSCEKFEGDQTVPAFLKIDSISLSTDFSTQGTASHAITDAWVYIDGDYLGTFQLPARVPVLKTGKHEVEVLPGIKQNGIATTRADYPYFTATDKYVTFGTDSTTSLGTLGTVYQESTIFLFREDFEDLSIRLDTTPASDAWIQKTPAGSPYTFPIDGEHSGMIVMDTSDTFFECQSHDPMDIPKAPVYLEMNFNTTIQFSVGTFIYVGSYIYQSNIITLFPTNGKWKKIYINFTNTLNAYAGATKFRLSIGTYNDKTAAESRILIDNLKIVTLSTKK